MSHQTSLEITASTVEEALARGLDELGVTADAVTIEILDAGSRGFLGLGGRKVRLRLTLKSALAEAENQSAPAAAERSQTSPAEASSGPAADDDVLLLVRHHAEKLLRHMDVPYERIDVFYDAEDSQVVHVDVQGDDLNILIGRRAEVLNAFQYILSLIIGRHLERWLKIVVDVAHYRERRTVALQHLALRMAEQAVESGRKQYLEPMPANERRIVHLALRDRDDVQTRSVGEEPTRKVMIIPL